jgi:hypothetical protein
MVFWAPNAQIGGAERRSAHSSRSQSSSSKPKSRSSATRGSSSATGSVPSGSGYSGSRRTENSLPKTESSYARLRPTTDPLFLIDKEGKELLASEYTPKQIDTLLPMALETANRYGVDKTWTVEDLEACCSYTMNEWYSLEPEQQGASSEKCRRFHRALSILIEFKKLEDGQKCQKQTGSKRKIRLHLF